MVNVEFIDKNNFICEEKINSFSDSINVLHSRLHSATSGQNDFKGWLDWPINYSKSEIEKIKSVAEKIKNDSEILVVIGVGGSYLGARAAIEFLNSENYNFVRKDAPKIFFVGNSLSTREIFEILDICKSKEVSINVVSKSGTTTEPAIAFRIFKNFMRQKYRDEARNRIYCSTDPNDGALRKMADMEGYTCFNIPKNIGGRFSVLTAVGLLPLAVSGADIDEILKGSQCAYTEFLNPDLKSNVCYKYAVMRNILYENKKHVEMFVSYEPRMRMLLEWCKQLFGESEGKEGKGILPISSIFTTDLHSLGQFVQEGSKILFETVLTFDSSFEKLEIKPDEKNLDGLNYLSGKSLDEINHIAFQATLKAHSDGSVPNIVLKMGKTNEYNLGYLIYFFEKACAMSGYLLGVNPFDQPGVEAYKKNMFKLLAEF